MESTNLITTKTFRPDMLLDYFACSCHLGGMVFREKDDVFPTGKKKDAPIDSLKRCLASGKFTEEQYEEPKAILERDGAH